MLVKPRVRQFDKPLRMDVQMRAQNKVHPDGIARETEIEVFCLVRSELTRARRHLRLRECHRTRGITPERQIRSKRHPSGYCRQRHRCLGPRQAARAQADGQQQNLDTFVQSPPSCLNRVPRVSDLACRVYFLVYE